MTRNTGFLHDTLSKRIARGKASVHDLPLLEQLLLCQRRQYLAIGTTTGVGLVVMVLTLVWLLSA